MSDSYQDWVERMAKSESPPPVKPNDSVRSSSGKPFQKLDFLLVDREKYIGEVALKGDDLIYHFYPKDHASFEEKMAETFLEIFKLAERVEAAYTEELCSWAVRARGFAMSPMADTMALKVFSVLDRKLG